MTITHPDHETLRSALALAARAPSVHNTQPWLWRVGDKTVQLYADTGRQLSHTDPDGRDLILSCGAMLHHLQVAAQGLGWKPVVHRLPNPDDPDHLAAVEFRAAQPTAAAVRLGRAITDRRTDRRRYTSWEVPAAHVTAMVAAGAACGVIVHDIEDGGARARLTHAFERAAREHARDAGYEAELDRWSGRHAEPAGVPARSAVVATDPMTRSFADPVLPQSVLRDTEGTDRLLLLATAGDDRLSRLRAGEAASAVLLTATTLGMATCPLTEPLELPDTRDDIRTEVIGDSGFPQMIIRVGWAATSSEPLTPTPRRPVDEFVHRL
ncbi:Acg family FMN-binding oxidoreductase [Nocardia sp. alder85J]|uniref:Acg family FMN-binding oxidoreductase n=1 Tax=Nocardia sp. alder85J TaxID=2862949 RepID=UPI001CD2979E|nr:NAD(P)H nitroreductase [Nocardia sp. alder85J]MCX4092418.1 NAD(P)H nitroreductase [Nocardia sp. alder85J]